MINTKHPKYKDLDVDTRLAINVGHVSRDYIEAVMRLDVSNKTLKALYKAWIDNEYKLQELWGFDVNINYIRWWNVPKCTCPKLDNDDAYPTGHYVTSSDCPIHGNSIHKGELKLVA